MSADQRSVGGRRRLLMRWLLLAVPLSFAAACTDTSEPEERVAALEAQPQSIIVGRTAEVNWPETGWLPLSRERVEAPPVGTATFGPSLCDFGSPSAIPLT